LKEGGWALETNPKRQQASESPQHSVPKKQASKRIPEHK
jgi:hypothetical protein